MNPIDELNAEIKLKAEFFSIIYENITFIGNKCQNSFGIGCGYEKDDEECSLFFEDKDLGKRCEKCKKFFKRNIDNNEEKD